MKKICLTIAVALFAISIFAQTENVEVTVYNSGFGLVKEIRQMDIKKGENHYFFDDVAAMIEPQSVLFKSLTDPSSIALLEQNYEYDLLNARNILAKSIGKKVTCKDGITGTLLSAPGVGNTYDAGIIVKCDDGKIMLYPSIEYITELPEGLIAKPTLNMLIDSPKDQKHRTELSYITQGFQWNANYVVLLNDKDDQCDINGWVTVNNNCGTSFNNANLTLVAGDVNRVTPVMNRNAAKDMSFEMAGMAMPAPAKGFAEEGFFEYHLYKLGRNTDLKSNESKQISLLTGNNVKITKKMTFTPHLRYQSFCLGFDVNPYAVATSQNTKIPVILEIKNAEENNLGMPMPKGTVKIYKKDRSGNEQFVGEDRIDHTPKDETIKLRAGNAFDIVGEYKLLEYKRISNNTIEETYAVTIKNHKKDEDCTVYFYENLWGDWKITKKDSDYNKIDAYTIEFPINVKKDSVKTITYTIRTKY
ncbi:MAG: DUF4139 domain-containing protein [Armatimonadetes bacterium]|nr:DUF4139 domain-containing protein [Candidatus Hippobium faecium]